VPALAGDWAAAAWASTANRWRIGAEVYGDRDILPKDVISRKLSVPQRRNAFSHPPRA